MAQGFSIALGVGLFLLWLTGINTPGATRWLVWFDLVAAIAAFAVAGSIRPRTDRALKVGAPGTLAIGLLFLWIAGLIAGATPWLTWWNFAFACGFGLVALGSVEDTTASGKAFSERWFATSSDRAIGAARGWPVPYYLGQGPYAGGAGRMGRGPRGYRRADEKIREDLHDRLWDSWYVDSSEVEVIVANGNVTLKGTVPSRRERRLIEELAESVPGVIDVDNRLEVPRRRGEGEKEIPIRAA